MRKESGKGGDAKKRPAAKRMKAEGRRIGKSPQSKQSPPDPKTRFQKSKGVGLDLEKYRDLVDQALIGFYITQNHIMIFCNQRLAEIFGYDKPENLLGIHIRQLVDPASWDMVDHQVRLRESGSVDKAHYEFIGQRKDGRLIHLEVLGSRTEFQGKPAVQGSLIDITDYRQAELAKQEGEKRQAAILNNIPLILYSAQAPSIYDAIWMSGNAERITGFSSQRFVLEPSFWRSRLHPNDCEKVLRHFEQIKTVSNPEIEYRWKCADGSYRWFLDRVVAIQDEDTEPVSYMGVWLDITERKKAEEAVWASENRFRTVVEEAKDSIFIKDAHLVYRLVNPAMAELLGLPLGKIIGQTDFQLFGEETGRQTEMVDRKVLAGETVTEEMVLPIREIQRTFHTIKVPLRDPDGQVIGLCGIARDVSAKKEAERLIKQSFERYQSLFENSPVALLEIDFSKIKVHLESSPDSAKPRVRDHFKNDPDEARKLAALVDIIDVNKKALEVFGTAKKRTLKESPPVFFTEHIPDLFGDILLAISEGRPTMTGEFAIKTFNGDIRQVELKWSVAPGYESSLSRVMMSLIDITESKSAAEKIQFEKDRFMMVSKVLPFGMILIDCDGSYIYTNPKFSELFGYQLEDVPDGRTWFRLAYPDPNRRREAISAWKDDMKDNSPGESKPRVFAVRCQDGSQKVVLFISVQLGNGQYLVTCQDITEQKRNEERIRESLKEKEILLREVHHRVKNSLQIVSGLLTLQTPGITSRDVLDVFESGQNRIRAMAMVHDILFSTGNLQRVDFKKYLHTLLLSLTSSLFLDTQRIQTQIECQEVLLNISTAIPLGLIVNELLTNSLKHAFPGGRAGTVRIELRENSERTADHFTLTVGDDGIGMPVDSDIRETRTLGLKLVTMLTQQLGGVIEMKSGPGTEVAIRFNIREE